MAFLRRGDIAQAFRRKQQLQNSGDWITWVSGGGESFAIPRLCSVILAADLPLLAGKQYPYDPDSPKNYETGLMQEFWHMEAHRNFC